MSFSTNTFLFLILPFLIACSFLFRKNQKICRTGLLFANLLILFIGDAKSLFILIPYTIAISFFAIILSKNIRHKKSLFILFIIAAASPLVLYKSISTVNNNILLPVGISFYTFQAVSLLSDIYKRQIEKIDFLSTSTYLTFFPTVVSGPITRFNTFKEGFNNNSIKKENLEEGLVRFVVGLAKKVLIADKLVPLVNYYFDSNVAQVSVLGIWIASIGYSLELYFDFSGYSDMAIGIAKALGFNLDENFNSPYLAGSIGDFWKRWHISLTKWFKDYIYIPLGGNRCSVPRHLFNMLVVWLFTGLWHGVNWTFIVWGIFFLVLLIIEKYFKKFSNFINSHKIFGHVYTLILVNIAWILFRSPSLSFAWKMIKGLVGIGNYNVCIENIALKYIPMIMTGIIVCIPWKKLSGRYKDSCLYKIAWISGLSILTVLSFCSVINSTFTAFIYGKF